MKPTELRLAIPKGKRLAELVPDERAILLQRGRWADPAVASVVREIINDVRERGDAALRDLAQRFDHAQLTALEVPAELCATALNELKADVRAALEASARAIHTFHSAQRPGPMEVEVRRGVRLGRRSEPLGRVGVYAPGGSAAYPSSVLMGVVPARVAGVDEVILASPPGSDGLPPRAVLAAAALAGADRVFAIGGAGAIAALAFGTETVPRVDKIVGPGNAYVTEAKRQLNGDVAIDTPAGPSEVLILADQNANPQMVAVELLAQAEHDRDASAVLLSTSAALIDQVAGALELFMSGASRGEIMSAALSTRGALLVADNEDEAFGFATEYAPEHLLVLLPEPRRALERVRSAGSVFLGPASSVAFGDYTTGANHVLPTAGLARAYSGLSTSDFIRCYTFQEVDAVAARELSPATEVLAVAEGLPGHAAAANLRNVMADSPVLGPVLRSAYESIVLYEPNRAPCEIDLSDNTNLFGVSPSVERVLSSIPHERITRYPAVFAAPLKRAIADRFDVGLENVSTGCGSDDVLDSALRAFCEPGDRVVFAAPTFTMVPAFAQMNAAQAVPVPLTGDLRLDVDALVAAGGRVTYVCRPNNPTGTSFSRYQIDTLAARVPGVLLLDEAYADFADDNFTRQAVRSERMISLRTLSKAFGLAGLRVGIAVGPAPLIQEIEKSRGPYKVSQVAEVAGISVLNQDAQWVRGVVREVRQNRLKLKEELERMGFRACDSGGNFVLFRVREGGSALDMAAALRARGVAVRPFPDLVVLGDCLRVTVGPWPLMERFLKELAAL
jgi:histidinol dehydrogenase